MRDAEPPETRQFERVLENGFELVARDGAYELRRRRQGLNDTICADIPAE
jgi:hypothetical protein